jgi:hypothetical protein
MSSETPSLAECIAFMSFCVKDESTIVLREHMAEGRAILGYLRDLAAARRDAQALREALRRTCDWLMPETDPDVLAAVDAALAADDAQRGKEK